MNTDSILKGMHSPNLGASMSIIEDDYSFQDILVMAAYARIEKWGEPKEDVFKYLHLSEKYYNENVDRVLSD